MEQTNRLRSERAMKGLEAYLIERDGEGCRALDDIADAPTEGQLEESISDLICDLLHLAKIGCGWEGDGVREVVATLVARGVGNWDDESFCGCGAAIPDDHASDGIDPTCGSDHAEDD